MPAEDPSPRFVSNVISDYIVDQVSTNDAGLVIIPVAVGSGKTYAIADSVVRCLRRGDDRRIFFLTPNKNPRGDFKEAVLAACSSRGISIGKDDVVMAESWEDTINNRLNRCDDGTVRIDLSAYAELEKILSLDTKNASGKKGIRKHRAGEQDRSKPFETYWGLTVASHTALKSSYGEYRKYLLDSLSRFAFLFSSDEAHREFGKAALHEANDLLRTFRRTVSRCFWGDFESFIKRNGIDFGLDTETVVQAMLREKSSGWAWVRNAFPETSYIDSRVMVMTNKKAVFGIDTVLFGTIDPYSSDSCIIFIDESDATKRDTLNTLIDQAVTGPVDFIRYCEGLNKRLDSTLGRARFRAIVPQMAFAHRPRPNQGWFMYRQRARLALRRPRVFRGDSERARPGGPAFHKVDVRVRRLPVPGRDHRDRARCRALDGSEFQGFIREEPD